MLQEQCPSACSEPRPESPGDAHGLCDPVHLRLYDQDCKKNIEAKRIAGLGEQDTLGLDFKI